MRKSFSLKIFSPPASGISLVFARLSHSVSGRSATIGSSSQARHKALVREALIWLQTRSMPDLRQPLDFHWYRVSVGDLHALNVTLRVESDF